jgi:hypothetical protein
MRKSILGWNRRCEAIVVLIPRCVERTNLFDGAKSTIFAAAGMVVLLRFLARWSHVSPGRRGVCCTDLFRASSRSPASFIHLAAGVGERGWWQEPSVGRCSFRHSSNRHSSILAPTKSLKTAYILSRSVCSPTLRHRVAQPRLLLL